MVASLVSDLGPLLLGVAALITAIGGAIVAVRAGTKAQEAIDASPQSVLEGLRTEVQTIVDAYHEASDRYSSERAGMEDALVRERRRADAAEAVVFQLRAEHVSMKIDMGALRAEAADLRSRFEQAISRREQPTN